MKTSEIEILVEQVENGHIDPLAAYIELHKLIVEAEKAIDTIKQSAINEAGKYPEKSFEKCGVIVEKRNSPAKWDYSSCEIINIMQDNVKKLQKIAQNGGVDPTTGELLQAKKIEGKPIIAIKLQIQ
jgi:hypothetical protein